MNNTASNQKIVASDLIQTDTKIRQLRYLIVEFLKNDEIIAKIEDIWIDELNKIKGTVDGNTGMLHVLRGIYHIRIEYPDDR